MKLLKDWRIILWFVCVIASIALIGPSFDVRGVAVDTVSKNSTFYGRLSPGDVVYAVATEDEVTEVSSLRDLEGFEDYEGYLTLDTSKGTMVVKKDPDEIIGLEVRKPKSTNLQLGLDLEGGVRVVVTPKGNVSTEILDQIKSTLETRINIYGLREAIITPLYGEQGFVQIEMAGGTEGELRELLEKQGKFEAKIPREIDLMGGTGSLLLDGSHDVSIDNDIVVINGKSYEQGEKLVLEEIEFEVWNVTDEKIVLAGVAFTGDEVRRVHFDPQNSYLRKAGNGYEYGFVVVISTEAAERFAKITREIPLKIDTTGKEILESKIYFYLDENLVNDLQIAGSLKGNPYTSPMVTGGGLTKEEALQSKRELQSILRSGSLPIEIEIVKAETVSPKLGKGFIDNAVFAGMVAVIAVCFVVFLRYRKLKFVVPISLVSMSEVLIILGVASLIQWTIDLAAIAGIIAAVGTSVDAQIILIDEALRGEEAELSLKVKLKRAFFTIFGAAGTTIGAMLPLMILGFGVLRGFAITTTIGILIGIIVTRPAFGRVLERVV